MCCVDPWDLRPCRAPAGRLLEFLGGALKCQDAMQTLPSKETSEERKPHPSRFSGAVCDQTGFENEKRSKLPDPK